MPAKLRAGLSIIALVALAGCVTPITPIVWMKDGMTEEALRRDRYECIREATYPATFGTGGIITTRLRVDEALYRLCMQARGYAEQKN